MKSESKKTGLNLCIPKGQTHSRRSSSLPKSARGDTETTGSYQTESWFNRDVDAVPLQALPTEVKAWIISRVTPREVQALELQKYDGNKREVWET